MSRTFLWISIPKEDFESLSQKKRAILRSDGSPPETMTHYRYQKVRRWAQGASATFWLHDVGCEFCELRAFAFREGDVGRYVLAFESFNREGEPAI